MSLHMMIDLETLATTPDAHILTMGIVVFDPHYIGINPDNCHHFFIHPDSQYDRRIDAATVTWWMGQSDLAKEAFTPDKFSTAGAALRCLNDLFKEHDIKAIWSHGSVFDIMILENLYASMPAIEQPWTYKQIRDTRTLFWLAECELPRHDKAHDALADAIHQATYVQKTFQFIHQLVS